MQRTILRLSFAVALSAWTACANVADDNTDFVLADSAGIVIATNELVPDSVPLWKLAPNPTLTIGTDDEDDKEQLYRVQSAVRLSNGNIAILNGGSFELRIYSPDGVRLYTSGRNGKGPGEFSSPDRLMLLRGDTLVVWDSESYRLTYLSPEGKLVRTTAMAAGSANPTAATVAPDGSFLIVNQIYRIPKSGFAEVPVTVSRFNPDGTLRAQIGEFPLRHIGVLDAENMMIGSPLFDANTTVAGDDNGFWVGTARSYEMVRHDTSGKVTRIVRWRGPSRAISSADVDEARRERRERASVEMREGITRMQAAQPVAEQFPAYQRIMSGIAGEVLVEDFAKPGVKDGARWTLMDSTGRIIGRLALPPRFALLELGRDYLLGRATNELDIEQVQLYRLERTR